MNNYVWPLLLDFLCHTQGWKKQILWGSFQCQKHGQTQDLEHTELSIKDEDKIKSIEVTNKLLKEKALQYRSELKKVDGCYSNEVKFVCY